MTTAEHALTRTYKGKGVAALKVDMNSSCRSILAKDIRDVRSIVGSKYNKGLLEVIEYNKNMFPKLMRKSENARSSN